MFESVEATSHQFIRRAARNTTAGNDFTLTVLLNRYTVAWITAIVLFVLHYVVHYTFGLLVPTLAAIESTTAAEYVPISVHDDDNNLEEPEFYNDSRDGLVTTGLISTIRHIRGQAGRLSPFRGTGPYMVCFFSRIYLSILLFSSSQPRFVLLLSHMITEVIMANITLVWIHRVISKPSKSWWIKRIPNFESWRAFAPIVAVRAFVVQLSHFLPLYLGLARIDYMHLILFSLPGSLIDSWPMLSRSVAWLLLSFVLTVIVEAPVMVIMTRVGASLLPADVETIVPFDRTFDGKIVPGGSGGGGHIGMLDAWRTLSWTSRIRFAKLVARAVGVMFTIYVVAEFIFSMTGSRKGPDLARWVRTYGGWRWT